MNNSCVLVLTTVGTKQFAADLAQSIVDARLAACVQIQPVQSVYRWQGAIQSQPEWQLTIKTTEARYVDLERHIRANHSYQTPEIVHLALTGGSPEYLAWIDESVSS